MGPKLVIYMDDSMSKPRYTYIVKRFQRVFIYLIKLVNHIIFFNIKFMNNMFIYSR